MNSNNPVGAALSIIAMLSFVAVVVLLGFVRVEVPPSNRDFFNMGFGAMISFATMGAQYFIGSSKGSADKTEAAAVSNAQKDMAINNLIQPGSGTVVVK